ncbi:MAG TPA: TRAP transporter large permease subunit [Burkholderiaceae bacterium]|nr:TRAP transporter large permease subunit [Burkholderiaceae bacterium]
MRATSGSLCDRIAPDATVGALGLLLLALALVLMLCTGWPTYVVLLGVCSIGALAGLATGTVQPHMLAALPDRVIGLLNHDLLQALVIYGLVGALLIRLELAGSVYGGLAHALRPPLPRAAPALAGLLLGALLAPINGSVGASLITLNRSTAVGWAGMPPARRTALVAVASTLGVLVPPSLVLLLLGDAMLRAHTEGLDLARALSFPLAAERIRVVNTQDVMQAVLPPAALLLLGWLALSVWVSRHDAPAPRSRPATHERVALLVVPAALLALLVLVASGRVRAVEGAATAGAALLLWGAVSGQLTRERLAAVLSDAMVITGVLFALLLAATTFSLLLRLLGTDRLVAGLVAALSSPRQTVLVVLGVLLLCAFVLDAFELTFLVVPIVMPPLLSRVGDAAWVSALVLLVLQLGFLLPPFGYSVVLARGQTAERPPWPVLTRALGPYLLWLLSVTVLLVAWPEPTRWLRSAPVHLPAPDALDAQRIDDLLREMSRPRDGQAP